MSSATTGLPQQDVASGQSQSVMHRVKLYKLNPQGLWDDKGTGHVAMEFLPKPGAQGLVVVGEADYKILLVHRLCSPDKYTRQGENTIITWLDDDIGTDVALSFQEEDGCAAIWDRIQKRQDGNGNPVNSSGAQQAGSQLPTSSSVNDDAASALNSLNMGNAGTGAAGAAGGSNNGMLSSGAGNIASGNPAGGGATVTGGVPGQQQQQRSAVCIKLPWPEVRTLPDINKALSEIPLVQRERVAMNIHNEGHYLPRLLDVFSQCEDIDDREGLSHLYSIIKCLIMMNDMQLVEQMVSDKYFWGVVGALEYDPDLAPKKAEHRSFLKNVVTFKEVVDIPDEATKTKIHSTFRIAYIRDAVLPRALDDASFAALHTTMIFNYMDILASLQQSPSFFQTLFEKLRTVDIHSEQSAQLMSFLQEVCHLTAHPNCGNRAELMALFMKENILDVLARGLSSSHPRASSKAMEVILMLIQSDVAAIRAAILEPPHTMLAVLIQQLLGDDEHGLPEQALEALKYLLDPESMDFTTQRNAFLELFYNEFMEHIVNVIAAAGRALTGPSSGSKGAVQLAGAAGAAATGDAAADGAAATAVKVEGVKAEAVKVEGVKVEGNSFAGTGASNAREAAAIALKRSVEATAAPSPSPPASGPSSVSEGSKQQQIGGSWGCLPGSSSTPGEKAAQTAVGKDEKVKTDMEEPPVPPPFVLALVLDLMQYCVTHHHFRIKYFVLRHTIIHKVLKLLKSPKRWLAVGALRFFRTCVGLKDDFYNRYITKNELFREPLDAFLENGEKPNLLNSTFLEMMEFMRSGDQGSLMLHFIDRYWSEVEGLTYVNTFQQMRKAVDEFQAPGQFHRSNDREAGPTLAAAQRNTRELSRDEEAYFSEAAGDDEDEEDSDKAAESPHAHTRNSDGSSRATHAGLVGDRSNTAAVFSAHMGRAGVRLGSGGGEDADRAGSLGISRSVGDRLTGGHERFQGGAFTGLVPYGDDDDDMRGTEPAGGGPRSTARVGAASSGAKSAAASLFSRSSVQRSAGLKESNWFPQQLSKPSAAGGGSSSGSAAAAGMPQQQQHVGHVTAQAAVQSHQDLAQGAPRDGGFSEHSDNGGLLGRRPAGSGPQSHNSDAGGHMLSLSVPDKNVIKNVLSARMNQGTMRRMQAAHASAGQPITTGAQHTGARAAPMASQQQSMALPGSQGLQMGAGASTGSAPASGMAAAGAPMTGVGLQDAGGLVAQLAGEPQQQHLVHHSAVQGALPQGAGALPQASAQQPAQQAPAGLPPGLGPAPDAAAAQAAGDPSSDAKFQRKRSRLARDVPASLGDPAPLQHYTGAAAQQAPAADGPSSSATATAAAAGGAVAQGGDNPGALRQPPAPTEASHVGSMGPSEADAQTMATGVPSGAVSAPTLVAPASKQMVDVQGTVAQGLPVPSGLASNENRSVPMGVATGVPVAVVPSTAPGTAQKESHATDMGTGEPAVDDEGQGAPARKRIADVELNAQAENGALTHAVKKALKVGHTVHEGKMALEQRPTPHS